MSHYCDTHAHIYLPEFKDQMDTIVQRAEDSKVLKVALPNIGSSTTKALKETADMNPDFHPMMGIHPCSIKPESYRNELNHVLTELESNYTSIHGKGYCAVGEIGIDLYWDKSTLDIQTEAFEQQMLWAFEKNLPVAVHCRDAYDEVITSIASMEAKRPKGVLHCFTGTIEQANALIDLGFLLGIGGVVTFKNSGLDKVVEQVDLQHLILETDSPYLAPTPYRGKRNEPSYTALVAEKIAAAKGLENPLESVGKPTSENAANLFNW